MQKMKKKEGEREREEESLMPLCKANVGRCNLLARKKILKRSQSQLCWKLDLIFAASRIVKNN